MIRWLAVLGMFLLVLGAMYLPTGSVDPLGRRSSSPL